MNSICRSLVLLVAFATLLRAEDASDADTLWKKEDDAIKALNKQPETAPKSREEMMAYVKKLITAADDAGKEFTDKFPHDPRRWKIKMFDAMTANARGQLGLKEHGEMKAILAEILSAPDADAESKGQASALSVLFASRGAGTAGDQWVKQAEEHLKKYPDAELNPEIKEQARQHEDARGTQNQAAGSQVQGGGRA